MQLQPQKLFDDNGPDTFAASRSCFDALVARLHAAESMALTHSEVESVIQDDGMEVLRQLMQGHVQLRHLQETKHEVVEGADGVDRTHRRERPRQLMTIFGPIEIERISYGARGSDSLCPLDAELNLPPEKQSHGVRRRAAVESAKGSFDEAVAALQETTGAKVAKRQVEQLAVRAAQDFDDFYQSREVSSAAEVEQTGSINVLTTDAKGVRLHLEDLRPQTQKAAKKRREAAATDAFRLGLPKPRDATERDRKRMATVASVYTIEPYVRRPEDVVGELKGVRVVDDQRPKPEKKRVWASVKEGPEDVLCEMFEEALRRDPERMKHWVGLVDGNETQLLLLQELSRIADVEITIILDLLHVASYVWKAGHALHGRGTRKAETWVRERILEILRGHSSQVAAGMRRSATMRSMTRKARQPVDTCADYLLKYRDFLHYDEYLSAGYPIATGVIEGACRYLVKDRMEITGAIWRLDSAEAVLQLRALRASGDFGEYWQYHEQQENLRHHKTRYANGVPSATNLVRPVKRTAGHLRVVK
jgi:hypothetical protein